MKNDIDFSEVHQICSRHGIEVNDLKSIVGSFHKRVYFINQKFLLRVSGTSMALEQEKFLRVATLQNVPKILYTGVFEREVGPCFYTFLTMLPGDDFVNVYNQTTEAEQKQLGEDAAAFLDHLQELDGRCYDIGLYVPAIPGFPGTWREGHQKYWELLMHKSENLPLQPGSFQVFDRAFRFLRVASPVLDYQTGPKLLHNDFHPKNVLLHQGKFSGVIDWECSQFGEADFELCHLIHWCLYPPKAGIDFRIFLRAFFDASPKCTEVPDLAQRLTIYQMEHEIQQIIWNASETESWRVPRLVHWMNGGVQDLLRELAV